MPVAPPTARSVTADGPPASSSRVAEARIRSFVDAIVGPARRNAALSRPVGRCRPVPKLSSGEVLLASQSHYSKIRAIGAIRICATRRAALGRGVVRDGFACRRASGLSQPRVFGAEAHDLLHEDAPRI